MNRKCQRWFLTAVMAVGGAAMIGGAAHADPYSPAADEIRGMSDATQNMHGPPGQLSSIDPDWVIESGPMGGIHLTVRFRVGTGACDPLFGCEATEIEGLDFARVSLGYDPRRFEDGTDPDTGDPITIEIPFNLTDFDGIKWCIMSDTDIFVQPFLQTAPDWTFYEPGPGGYNVPGDMNSHMVTLDFNDAQNFSGLTPANIVHPDGNGQIGANFWGLQIVGPAPTPGEEIVAHIWINSWIPEPSSFLLLCLGALGVLGFNRRRG